MASKKDIIINYIKDCPLLNDGDKKWKQLTYEDFVEMGMTPCIEYGQKYNDVIYARQIFQRMGFRVLTGAYCLYIIERDGVLFETIKN